MKQYLNAALKSVNDSGAFTAIASMATVDRDGEVVVKGAFDPLPATIQVHAFHNFTDPVGQARPYYQQDALMVDGWFGRTARAQEVRQMVVDGLLPYVSIGFMGTKKEPRDGVPHIVSGELLEVSLVSVPSNREAAVLSVRGWGSSHPTTVADARRIARQAMLDLARLDLDLARRGLDRIEGTKYAPVPRDLTPIGISMAISDAKQFLADLSRKDR